VSTEQLARGAVMLFRRSLTRKSPVPLARVRKASVNGQQHSNSFESQWYLLEVVVE
jgi:hypothetical protein